jgi:heterodisulfide reductase subunit A1
VDELKKAVADEGIDPGRVFFYEAYLPHYRGLAARMERFESMLREKDILTTDGDKDGLREAQSL